MENYEHKRINFKEQVLKHFAFLVIELGYNRPIVKVFKQENGTVISDILEYKNHRSNKTVRVENHYHPNDYGCEINFWNSTSDVKNGNEKMLDYCLKENQDLPQNYIEKIAESVKVKYKTLLS